MQGLGAAPAPGPHPAAPDLAALAANLTRIWEAVQQRPAAPAPAAAGLLVGAAAAAAACMTLALLFRWLSSASHGRLSRRRKQREAVQQLSELSTDELRRLLGDVNLPQWVSVGCNRVPSSTLVDQ